MRALSKPRKVLFHGLILALTVQLSFWAPGAWAATPTEDIKSLINEVQTILQNNQQKNQRLQLIEKAADKHLAFREMAKRSLETTWDKLNQTQQKEFVSLFSQLLKASYAGHLDEFVKARVDFKGETCKANCSEVRVVIIRPNDKIPVNFRLQKESQGWMIYDMEIEGVSLVDNFRSQFQRAISMISYQGLVTRLKDHLKAESRG